MENKSEKIRKSITKDGLTYEMTVEKVEGGYIITKCMWGDKKLSKPTKDGRTTEYVNKEEKMVSTTNPFDKEKEEEEPFGFSLNSAMDSIADMEGSLKI